MSWETRVRSLALVAGAAAFGLTLAQADLRRATALATSVGWLGFCAILVPQCLCLTSETWSWRAVLRFLGAHPPFFRLLRIRAGTEALAQSLPAGPLVAESVTPWLLRDVGVGPSVTIASQVARRYFLIWSQGACAALLAICGYRTLQTVDARGPIGLAFATAAMAVSLLGAAWLLRLVLSRRQVAERLLDGLSRILWSRAVAWLQSHRAQFTRTDEATRRVFCASLPRRLMLASPLMLGWLLETAETLLITRLLGLHWAFVLVAAMELLVALMRHLVFVVPAGLGVQDAGYLMLFHVLGAPDPMTTSAAFSLLKRAKELCWITLGYLLLAPDLLKLRFSCVTPLSQSAKA